LKLIRTLGLLTALIACVAARGAPPGEMGAMQGMTLEAGSGRVVTLTTAAASVFAADPKVVEVRPVSPTSLFLFGVGPGRTTVAAMSATGQSIAQFQVMVGPSGYAAAAAAAQIGAALPGRGVTAGMRGNGMVLNGMVSNPAEAERAAAAARSNLGDGQKLENRLGVQGGVQVNLRVRVVEMSRNLTRELGVNWQALANVGGRYGTLGFASAGTLATAATSALSSGYNFNTLGKVLDINNVIDALAQDQLVHVLAEPNLTTLSGETASFLVGGEFPIPVAAFNQTVSIEFKQYGVSLAFVPTVLDGGRISLHVRPEVSQLSTQGAITLQAGNASISIPALQVRRAETTVELGSGQSFAIAGLMQETTTLTGNGVPFLGDIPILGALFRSDSFQRNETELVILVTPYLVQPASSPSALMTPDAGWRAPSDLERILLLRQRARGERTDVAMRPNVPGDAGFIAQ
jgi:pilus assembly protein CpaC